MTDQSIHVFVYGTLKPGERAYDRLCRPAVRAIAPAIAEGRLYDLPLGYPAMTLAAGWVTGFCLTFANSEALAALDAFEEYDGDRPPEANEYQRIARPIYHPNRIPWQNAWMYVMSPERVEQWGGIWLPSGYWQGNRTVPGREGSQ